MLYLTTRLATAFVTFLFGVSVAGLFPSGADNYSYERSFYSDGAALREVLRAEAEYVRANNERDGAALDRLLADDLRTGGRLRTKERRLAFVTIPALESLSLETDGVRVHASPGAAVVTGRARMSGSHAGRSFGGWDYEYTRRYEKRGQLWQIVSMSFSYAR